MIGLARASRYGFSLLELSVVLIVIGLIAGAGITLGSGVMQSASRIKTQERLASIQYALDNYARINGYLPCPFDPKQLPNSASFGLEQRDPTNHNTCTPTGGMVMVGTSPTTAFIGGLPARSLGLPDSYASDAWGKKLTYAVSSNHVGDASSYADIRTGKAANLSVKEAGTSIPATYVVVSHGPTGVGAYATYGTTKSSCPNGTLDTDNCDYSDLSFTDALYNDGVVTSLFFDDFIVWGTNIANRSNATQPAAASSCSSTCENWCAQCKNNVGAGTTGYTTFVTGTAVLCNRIITSTTPCEATCVWGGMVAPSGPYLQCP